ncbi:YwqG family protein [Spirillospora sp. NPDC029432]|uniref:YwqG family protein n=1 Tax=Spirillospora sp. NPDC029432 TaxID=3154599 RepID=UPI003452E3AF
MDVEELEGLLRAGLPALHGRFRVELAEPGLHLADDGSLNVGLQLLNDATGECGQQEVQLVPAGQDPARVRSYLQAWVRSLPSLLACAIDRSGGRCLAPGMLEFANAVLQDDQAHSTEEFVERCTDPSTVQGWAMAADAASATQWIRDTCQNLGLDEHADALLALRRTGIDLIPRPDGTLGHTRLGGLPDLPPSEPWPHRHDRPMTLLAQIDLAEISRCDDDRSLPPRGLLQIFADLTGDTAWEDTAHGPGIRVMFQPPPVRSLTLTPPPATARTLPQRAVVPAVELSLPPLDSPFYRDQTNLDLTGDDPAHPSEQYAAFIEFLNEFHPPLSDDDQPRHRLLGYADTLQDDPWRHCANIDPGTPPTQWRLLAQIDSEPDALLGDNGMIYIFIPRDALATGDFTRVRGVWQMH